MSMRSGGLHIATTTRCNVSFSVDVCAAELLSCALARETSKMWRAPKLWAQTQLIFQNLSERQTSDAHNYYTDRCHRQLYIEFSA